jgi:predicted dithiol-disulfide oxidoreductase (DUF899 family)
LACAASIRFRMRRARPICAIVASPARMRARRCEAVDAWLRELAYVSIRQAYVRHTSAYASPARHSEAVDAWLRKLAYVSIRQEYVRHTPGIRIAGAPQRGG